MALMITTGLPLYVSKNGVFEGFEGEDVTILCSDPQKALPCVNTSLLMYCVTKLVQRPELKLCGEKIAYKEKNKKTEW